MSFSGPNPEKKWRDKKLPRLFRNRKCRSDNHDSFSAISAPSPLTAAATPSTTATGDATRVTAVTAAVTTAAAETDDRERQSLSGRLGQSATG